MASNTRPFLTSGAALASAATLVVATPAIVPNVTASPLISSAVAGYNLTTFADLLSVPISAWENALFQGYGGIVGPNNPAPSNPEETGGLDPWASGCDGGCFVFGLPAIGYLALDALINGNGEGWEDNENWRIGAVNYFYEGGPAAGTQWLAQSSIGAANPLLSVLITLAFTGPQLVTVIYDNALSLLADGALGLPVIGDYVYGAINAYLGPASQNEDYQKYVGGFGGILNYAADLLTGIAPAPPSAAISAPAAATTALAVGVGAKAAPAVAEAAVTEAPAVVEVQAPAAGQDSVAPAEAAAEATEAVVESAPAEAAGGSDAVTADAAESVTAADVVADSVPAAGPEATAPAGKGTATTGKRPVRDAVAKVTEKITSALGGAKPAAPAPAAPAEADSTAPAADTAGSGDGADSADSAG